MSPPDPARPVKIPVAHAVLLGALHGPAELVPISSSGHVTAVPWLLGWSNGELDDGQRKTFEVALHAGTAAALLIVRRSDWWRALTPRRLGLMAVAGAPPALAGLALESVIEKRLGTPATLAAGLISGSVAMALADRGDQSRSFEQAGWRDGVWLGLAQATALVPGVSRLGATLAAARLRGFARPDAYRVAELVGLAPIAGAVGLRALRPRPSAGASEAAPAVARADLAAGAGAAFLSTLLCERELRRVPGTPLWPFVGYRLGLAAALLARLRRGSTARPGPPPARP